MQWGTTVRNAICDVIESTIGTSMKIRLLTGDMPANPAATETGTLICEISCPSDYFAAASGGVKAKSGTWSGTSVATGIIGYARFMNSAGSTCHAQALVSKATALVTSASTPNNSVTLTFTSTTGVEVGDSVRGIGILEGATVLALTSTLVGLSMACPSGVASGARITFGDTSGDTLLNAIDITTVGFTITADEFSLVAPGE